jgi:hypothetical protein
MAGTGRANLEKLLLNSWERLAVLCGKAFPNTPANERTMDVSKRRRVIDTVVSVVLAIVPTALGLAVIWRWLAWILCWVLIFLYVVPDWLPVVGGWPKKSKRLVFVVAMLSFIGFYPVALSQWREEKAAATGGTLSMPSPEHNLFPKFEIGNSGATFVWGGVPETEAMKFLWDAGLRIETGSDGIEVTTPIRDRHGQMIAEIDRNKWKVSPLCWDKNYTAYALEVKDRRGHIVLQLRYLSDRVQIQGEWRDEFGNGVRLRSAGENLGAFIDIWRGPQMELKLERAIPPIFEYPSKEKWGQLIH